ncbi:MAG: hypothetical protein WB609_08935 [Candidatus Cybelea sp.]
MKSLDFRHYVLGGFAAAALLAGCGALPLSLSKGQSDTQPPIGAPSAMRQSRAIATHAERSRSWMLPEAKSEDLLYVSDYQNGVIVLSYTPPRLKYVGFLSEPQWGEGECVDKAQNVFITGSAYDIVEYAHGATTPKAILTDPFALPLSCSVDPTTGNLAVVGYPDQFHKIYGAAIFKKARGKPTLYEDTGFAAFACTYDNEGNLFLDGSLTSSVAIAKLQKGSSTFTNIPLEQSFNAVGGIQWDGQYVAVGDYYNAVIYEFEINGSSATKVGSTPLGGSGTVLQFFIDRGRVIVPSTFQNYSGFVKIFDYPAGGAAKRTHDVGSPNGTVVSRARRH